MHSKTRFANGMTAEKLLRIFGVALVKRDCSFTEISILDDVVDFFYVIGFISRKSAFFD